MFFGKEIFFNNIKELADCLPVIHNEVVPYDIIANTMKLTILYKVDNYLLVPCEESKFLLFMNKKDRKGYNSNFTNGDAIIGMLISQIYTTINHYQTLLQECIQLRPSKQFAFDLAYELLSFVNEQLYHRHQ